MKVEQHENPYETDGLATLARHRGISRNVLAAAGIETDDTGHRGWWAIPYPHRTGIWKRRYRNPDPTGRPKYLDDPGAQPHLYNPTLAGPGEEEIWFCEGEFDTLAVVDQGYRAIGIQGTGNVPGEDEEGAAKFKESFKRSWTLLFEDTLCIVIFDNDDSGRRAGRRLANGLDGVVFDRWDDRFGDVNEWHRADAAGLGKALGEFRAYARAQKGML